MTRFFVDKSSISQHEILFNEPAHIRALRLREGDELVLCDGENTDFFCRLTSVGKDSAHAEILRREPSRGEASVRVTALFAYAKGDRLDYAVQKSVELGAHAICLFPSSRVIALPKADSLPKKLARLSSIAKSAAEQSGRGIIPAVTAADSFAAAVSRAAEDELSLFCYEDELQTPLRDVLERTPNAKTISVMTGCEGGFSPEEATSARDGGLLSVSLGPRILRCETAPVAALSAIMYATGNL